MVQQVLTIPGHRRLPPNTQTIDSRYMALQPVEASPQELPLYAEDAITIDDAIESIGMGKYVPIEPRFTCHQYVVCKIAVSFYLV